MNFSKTLTYFLLCLSLVSLHNSCAETPETDKARETTPAKPWISTGVQQAFIAGLMQGVTKSGIQIATNNLWKALVTDDNDNNSACAGLSVFCPESPLMGFQYRGNITVRPNDVYFLASPFLASLLASKMQETIYPLDPNQTDTEMLFIHSINNKIDTMLEYLPSKEHLNFEHVQIGNSLSKEFVFDKSGMLLSYAGNKNAGKAVRVGGLLKQASTENGLAFFLGKTIGANLVNYGYARVHNNIDAPKKIEFEFDLFQ